MKGARLAAGLKSEEDELLCTRRSGGGGGGCAPRTDRQVGNIIWASHTKNNQGRFSGGAEPSSWLISRMKGKHISNLSTYP